MDDAEREGWKAQIAKLEDELARVADKGMLELIHAESEAEAAVRRRDTAIASRNEAVRQRDEALTAQSKAEAERNDALSKCKALLGRNETFRAALARIFPLAKLWLGHVYDSSDGTEEYVAAADKLRVAVDGAETVLLSQPLGSALKEESK